MSSKRPLQESLKRTLQQFSIMKSIVHEGTKLFAPKPSVALVTGARPMSSSSEASKSNFWQKISVFGAFPVIGAVGCTVFLSLSQETEKERPPFVKYEYLRIRTKRFPWGDGTKSLFHNSYTNPLPDGYEDDI